MTLEMILIDDEEMIRTLAKLIIEVKGYKGKVFSNTKEFIENYESTQEEAENYFVDMRIKGDLEGPEKLFYYMKGKRIKGNFYFITANISEHDEEVIKRTKANLLIKKDLYNQIITILEKEQLNI